MKKKLFKYFIEFILITISITIAFLVENYRESKINKEDTVELLKKIKQDFNDQISYYTLIGDISLKHAQRFDSIIVDLRDCNLQENQRLLDVISYIPYMTEHTVSPAYESLRNSGLISNIENDTIISGLSQITLRSKREMSEYSENWKRSQEKVRVLLREIYKGNVMNDSIIGRVVLQQPVSKPIDANTCNALIFELTQWIFSMRIYADQLKQDEEVIVKFLPILEMEIENL